MYSFHARRASNGHGSEGVASRSATPKAEAAQARQGAMTKHPRRRTSIMRKPYEAAQSPHFRRRILKKYDPQPAAGGRREQDLVGPNARFVTARRRRFRLAVEALGRLARETLRRRSPGRFPLRSFLGAVETNLLTCYGICYGHGVPPCGFRVRHIVILATKPERKRTAVSYGAKTPSMQRLVRQKMFPVSWVASRSARNFKPYAV